MSRRLLTGLALALTLIASPCAAAQPVGDGEAPGRMNFQRIGHNPLFNRGMNAAIAVYHNFLYVGNRTDSGPGHPHPGVLVVDIANSRRPRVVGQLPPEPSGQTSRELRVWPQQKLLMVMLFRCSPAIHACPATAPAVFSIKFYDLSNPYFPQHISTYVPSRQPHEMFLWVDPKRPGRALLYQSTPSASVDPNRPNMIVTDISRWREGVFTEVAQANWNQLFTPQQVATLDVALHSMSVTNDGTRTYLAYLGGGFFVLDTSDLANAVPSPQMRLLTPVPATPRWTNQTVHSAIPLPGRPYALTTDELYGDLLDNPDNDHGCPWGFMHVIDVRDPANPRLLTEYRTEANTPQFCSTPQGQDDMRASHTAHNPTVFRNLAFISWHGSGFQAIDVADPTQPRQAGFFTPRPLAAVATEDPALTTTGNKVAMWSFPIVKNGKIWVLDIRNGLYSLHYRGPGARGVNRTIFREGNSNLTTGCPAVQISPRRLREGRATNMRVRVSLFGQPVENARVIVTGRPLEGNRTRPVSTDQDGRATIRVDTDSAGRAFVRAPNVAHVCRRAVRVTGG
jgi:hypothetical protein